MAKKDDRPVDVGLAALKGKDEATATEWWKERLGLIAAIPSDTARVGALTPQLRELSRLTADERRRLTRARIAAFATLPQDQQAKITTARKTAYDVDRALLESDESLVQELRGSVPGGDSYPTTTPKS
ncbi:MAG: hypothetical protein ABR525_06775 [Candidatus Limnocylindria bacterium]